MRLVLAKVNAFTAKLSPLPYSRKIEIRVLDDYSANMIRLEELGGTAVGWKHHR